MGTREEYVEGDNAASQIPSSTGRKELANARKEIVVPDLGLGGALHTVSSWLVRTGDVVVAADEILEITAMEVTVLISSPVSGIVTNRFVREDDVVRVGQVLGSIDEVLE